MSEELKKLKLKELGRVSESDYGQLNKLDVIVVLDNIRSAHNVGSVLRTTDAFLFDKVIATGITPIPPNKDITKTAIGAERTVEITYLENATDKIEDLKKRGYTVLGIEQTNKSIGLNKLPALSIGKKLVYIVGNEVKGVSLDLLKLCDHCVDIPMGGTKHSFNVSVCNGMVSWEIFKMLS